MTNSISIIGCGWLGTPLAKELIEHSYTVKGSTTSIEKIDNLKAFGIDAFFVELTDKDVKGAIKASLSGCDILVLNIPPGLRKQPENDFVKQIQLLIPYIEKSSIKKVIFISSTSVYNDDESIPTITEESIPNPSSESGKQLLEAEKLLQSNPHFMTTVLRFGGLFGADRHPAKYLSGKSNIKNPNAPVNLIHLEDGIKIIQRIIQKNSWNETFNASTPSHPSKKDYYTSVCREMNLPLPDFDNKSPSIGKCIDSSKLVQLLNYEFQVKLNN